MSRFQRSVSLLLLITFSFNQITFADPGAFTRQAAYPTTEVKFNHFSNLVLPHELGKIEAFKSAAGPAVLHIQTAHGNYDAQVKIEVILHELNKRYGVDTIFVEGSAYKLRPELLQFIPNNKEATLKVADTLTHKALLKGFERYLIQNPSAQVYGIEEVKTYKANRQVFKQVLRAKQQSEKFIKDMDQMIDRLASPYMNADLRNYLKRVELSELGQIDLGAWTRELKNLAKKNADLDLLDPRIQLDWPMLHRFFKLGEIEKNLNQQLFTKEKPKFLNALRKAKIPAANYEQIEKLLNETPADSALPDPETSILFEQMATALPRNFAYQNYPNVMRSIAYLILHSELKGERLMQEINALAARVADRLAKTKEEKELVELYHDYRLLKKLFALQLLPHEYDQLITDKGAHLRPSIIVKRFAGIDSQNKRVRGVSFQHLARVNALFDKAFEFYGLVKERDGQMLANVVTLLRETQSEKVAVITGGFHAAPFQQFFTEQNFTYALVTPKIENFDGYDAYIQSILRESKATMEDVPNYALTPAELRAHGLSATDIRIARLALEGSLAAVRSELRVENDASGDYVHVVESALETVEWEERDPEARKVGIRMLGDEIVDSGTASNKPALAALLIDRVQSGVVTAIMINGNINAFPRNSRPEDISKGVDRLIKRIPTNRKGYAWSIDASKVFTLRSELRAEGMDDRPEMVTTVAERKQAALGHLASLGKNSDWTSYQILVNRVRDEITAIQNETDLAQVAASVSQVLQDLTSTTLRESERVTPNHWTIIAFENVYQALTGTSDRSELRMPPNLLPDNRTGHEKPLSRRDWLIIGLTGSAFLYPVYWLGNEYIWQRRTLTGEPHPEMTDKEVGKIDFYPDWADHPILSNASKVRKEFWIRMNRWRAWDYIDENGILHVGRLSSIGTDREAFPHGPKNTSGLYDRLTFWAKVTRNLNDDGSPRTGAASFWLSLPGWRKAEWRKVSATDVWSKYELPLQGEILTDFKIKNGLSDIAIGGFQLHKKGDVRSEARTSNDASQQAKLRNFDEIVSRWIKDRKGETEVIADDGTVFEFRYQAEGEDDRFLGDRQRITVYHQGEEVGYCHFRLDSKRAKAGEALYSFKDDAFHYRHLHPGSSEDFTYEGLSGPKLGNSAAVYVKGDWRSEYSGIGRSLVGFALRITQQSGYDKFTAFQVLDEKFFTNLGFEIFRTNKKNNDYQFLFSHPLPDIVIKRAFRSEYLYEVEYPESLLEVRRHFANRYGFTISRIEAATFGEQKINFSEPNAEAEAEKIKLQENDRIVFHISRASRSELRSDIQMHDNLFNQIAVLGAAVPHGLLDQTKAWFDDKQILDILKKELDPELLDSITQMINGYLEREIKSDLDISPEDVFRLKAFIISVWNTQYPSRESLKTKNGKAKEIDRLKQALDQIIVTSVTFTDDDRQKAQSYRTRLDKPHLRITTLLQISRFVSRTFLNFYESNPGEFHKRFLEESSPFKHAIKPSQSDDSTRSELRDFNELIQKLDAELTTAVTATSWWDNLWGTSGAAIDAAVETLTHIDNLRKYEIRKNVFEEMALQLRGIRARFSTSTVDLSKANGRIDTLLAALNDDGTKSETHARWVYYHTGGVAYFPSFAEQGSYPGSYTSDSGYIRLDERGEAGIRVPASASSPFSEETQRYIISDSGLSTTLYDPQWYPKGEDPNTNRSELRKEVESVALSDDQIQQGLAQHTLIPWEGSNFTFADATLRSTILTLREQERETPNATFSIDGAYPLTYDELIVQILSNQVVFDSANNSYTARSELRDNTIWNVIQPVLQIIQEHPFFAMSGLGMGIAASVFIWRTYFPVSWYLKRDLSYYQSVEIFRKFGDSVIDPLIARLSHENQNTRSRVAKILGGLRNESSIPKLIQFISGNTEFVIPAIAALGEIKDLRAQAPVTEKLVDPAQPVRVRLAAAKALINLGEPANMRPILDRFYDENEDQQVREAIANVLGKLQNKEAWNYLRNLPRLQNLFEAYLVGAVGVYNYISRDQVTDVAKVVLENQAAAVIDMLSSKADEAFKYGFGSDKFRMLYLVIFVFGMLANEKAIPFLSKYLSYQAPSWESSHYQIPFLAEKALRQIGLTDEKLGGIYLENWQNRIGEDEYNLRHIVRLNYRRAIDPLVNALPTLGDYRLPAAIKALHELNASAEALIAIPGLERRLSGIPPTHEVEELTPIEYASLDGVDVPVSGGERTGRMITVSNPAHESIKAAIGLIRRGPLRSELRSVDEFKRKVNLVQTPQGIRLLERAFDAPDQLLQAVGIGANDLRIAFRGVALPGIVFGITTLGERAARAAHTATLSRMIQIDGNTFARVTRGITSMVEDSEPWLMLPALQAALKILSAAEKNQASAVLTPEEEAAIPELQRRLGLAGQPINGLYEILQLANNIDPINKGSIGNLLRQAIEAVSLKVNGAALPARVSPRQAPRVAAVPASPTIAPPVVAPAVTTLPVQTDLNVGDTAVTTEITETMPISLAGRVNLLATQVKAIKIDESTEISLDPAALKAVIAELNQTYEHLTPKIQEAMKAKDKPAIWLLIEELQELLLAQKELQAAVHHLSDELMAHNRPQSALESIDAVLEFIKNSKSGRAINAISFGFLSFADEPLYVEQLNNTAQWLIHLRYDQPNTQAPDQSLLKVRSELREESVSNEVFERIKALKKYSYQLPHAMSLSNARATFADQIGFDVPQITTAYVNEQWFLWNDQSDDSAAASIMVQANEVITFYVRARSEVRSVPAGHLLAQYLDEMIAEMAPVIGAGQITIIFDKELIRDVKIRNKRTTTKGTKTDGGYVANALFRKNLAKADDPIAIELLEDARTIKLTKDKSVVRFPEPLTTENRSELREDAEGADILNAPQHLAQGETSKTLPGNIVVKVYWINGSTPETAHAMLWIREPQPGGQSQLKITRKITEQRNSTFAEGYLHREVQVVPGDTILIEGIEPALNLDVNAIGAIEGSEKQNVSFTVSAVEAARSEIRHQDSGLLTRFDVEVPPARIDDSPEYWTERREAEQQIAIDAIVAQIPEPLREQMNAMVPELLRLPVAVILSDAQLNRLSVQILPIMGSQGAIQSAIILEISDPNLESNKIRFAVHYIEAHDGKPATYQLHVRTYEQKKERQSDSRGTQTRYSDSTIKVENYFWIDMEGEFLRNLDVNDLKVIQERIRGEVAAIKKMPAYKWLSAVRSELRQTYTTSSGVVTSHYWLQEWQRQFLEPQLTAGLVARVVLEVPTYEARKLTKVDRFTEIPMAELSLSKVGDAIFRLPEPQGLERAEGGKNSQFNTFTFRLYANGTLRIVSGDVPQLRRNRHIPLKLEGKLPNEIVTVQQVMTTVLGKASQLPNLPVESINSWDQLASVVNQLQKYYGPIHEVQFSDSSLRRDLKIVHERSGVTYPLRVFPVLPAGEESPIFDKGVPFIATQGQDDLGTQISERFRNKLALGEQTSRNTDLITDVTLNLALTLLDEKGSKRLIIKRATTVREVDSRVERSELRASGNVISYDPISFEMQTSVVRQVGYYNGIRWQELSIPNTPHNVESFRALLDTLEGLGNDTGSLDSVDFEKLKPRLLRAENDLMSTALVPAIAFERVSDGTTLMIRFGQELTEDDFIYGYLGNLRMLQAVKTRYLTPEKLIHLQDASLRISDVAGQSYIITFSRSELRAKKRGEGKRANPDQPQGAKPSVEPTPVNGTPQAPTPLTPSREKIFGQFDTEEVVPDKISIGEHNERMLGLRSEMRDLIPSLQIVFDQVREQTLPLRLFSERSTEELVQILSKLLKEAVYFENAGIVPPTPSNVLRDKIGEGRIVATNEANAWISDQVADQGHVLIDQSWIEIPMQKNARALYVLLTGLQKATRNQAQKPLITVVGDKDLPKRIAQAMLRQDSGLNPEERLEAQYFLDPDQIGKLIQVISADKVQNFVQYNDYGVSSLVTTVNDLPDYENTAGFVLDPNKIAPEDLVGVPFVIVSLIKAAQLVRGIPTEAERIKRLGEVISQVVPGARPSSQKGFEIEFAQFVEQVLINQRLIDVAA